MTTINENAFQRNYAPYVDTWSPRLLKQMVDEGRIVFAPIGFDRGDCRVFLSEDRNFYHMQGPTSFHRLSVCATNAARLQAHWDGFCANHGVRPFKR